MKDAIEPQPQSSNSPSAAHGFTRRAFIKGLGTSAISAATLGAETAANALADVNAERIHGPGAVPVTLTVNGGTMTFQLEPRTTLLEAQRLHAGLTGPKESCDRASCGSCTVLLGDDPVYACSMLAIEAQGAPITTIEGLAQSGELTRLQQAFVDQDGLQCGFCTPGMVMTLTALLRKNPHPSETEVRHAISGNLCRCGSQPRIVAAALVASGTEVADRLTIIHPHEHALA